MTARKSKVVDEPVEAEVEDTQSDPVACTCNCGGLNMPFVGGWQGDAEWTPPDYQIRGDAARHAADVIVAVNQTTAWVPLDMDLADMFYKFLKGDEIPSLAGLEAEPETRDWLLKNEAPESSE